MKPEPVHDRIRRFQRAAHDNRELAVEARRRGDHAEAMRLEEQANAAWDAVMVMRRGSL